MLSSGKATAGMSATAPNGIASKAHAAIINPATLTVALSSGERFSELKYIATAIPKAVTKLSKGTDRINLALMRRDLGVIITSPGFQSEVFLGCSITYAAKSVFFDIF
jgi:hypothetical protein